MITQVHAGTPAPSTPPAVALYRVCLPQADGFSCGSGTGIAERVVVTNSHVVGHRAGPAVEVRDAAGRRWQGKVIAANPAIDLALIHVDAPLARHVALAERGPRQGERVTVAGWTSGVREAQCVESRTYMDQALQIPVVETSAATASGDSGGGVYNERGELAAIHWGSNGRTASAVGVEFLDAWLDVVEQQCGPLGCRRRPVFAPPQVALGPIANPSRGAPTREPAPGGAPGHFDPAQLERTLALIQRNHEQIALAQQTIAAALEEGRRSDEALRGRLLDYEKKIEQLSRRVSSAEQALAGAPRPASADWEKLSARLAALEAAVSTSGQVTYRLRRVPAAKTQGE